MDKSNVAVEESLRKSDSLASASKSLGSIVQINSIAIDISCAMEEMESPAHDHFSIRGFVAGMRKKDSKMCFPFTSEGGDDDHASVDTLPPLSVPRFRWWQCSNCVPEILAERTGVQMLLADTSDAGDDNSKNKEGCNPSDKLIKYNPLCTHEGHEATACRMEENVVRNNVGGNPYSYIAETTPSESRERHSDIPEASNMVVSVPENPSVRVIDEPENASSGSEGVFSALPHRRKPKLRSLADIMEEEKNSTNEHPKARSASSSHIQDTSAEVEAVSDNPQIQSDVPLDVAKGAKSPQRKRKIALEEDRGPLAMHFPIATAKRSKLSIPNAERTCRRLEIHESESEGDIPTRMNLPLSGKNQQMKPKKNKALEISRKARQNHIDNRTGPLRDRVVSAETSSGNERHIASTVGGEMGQWFKISQNGQQMDKNFDASKSKRPEVEAVHNPLMHSRKSVLGDCDVRGKVALDLSLNSCMSAEKKSDNQESSREHTIIPDLNESITEKTPMTQAKQFPNLYEKRSLMPHQNLDMPPSCSTDISRENRRQLGVSEPQSFQNMDNYPRPSDDIPMEIIELLAKNKRERTLGNDTRKNLLPMGINSSTVGSPSVHLDSRPGMINFPFTSTRNNVSVVGGKMGILNFPSVNSQLEMGNLDQESQLRMFSSFTPNQQRKTQYSASNSAMLPPRTSEGADLLWPPRKNNVPFHLSDSHNRPIQPNGFLDHRYKGKAIVSDVNGHEKNAVREGRIGSQNKSLDAYSNDTIPAMQLLSLMDRRIPSGSSFKVGSNTAFLDKPFSPCNHHPRPNGNENQKNPFHNVPSLFRQGGHTKGFSPLLNGVCFSSENLKKSYLQGSQMATQKGKGKGILSEGPSNVVAQPSRGGALPLGPCTLNRNPADFSVPEAKNEYTLSAKDFKSRKRNSVKQRSRTVNLEGGQKRQRVQKEASGKERSRK